MAIKNIYIPREDKLGVITKKIDFKWFSGFAVSQKQKSIASLHEAAKNMGIYPILEVSTKSPNILGNQLSAFNLKMFMPSKNCNIAIENVFQGSKVFDNGGPYTDLYSKSPLEAKKDLRLKNSGNLIYFMLDGHKFELTPKTLFYDWIYISALSKNPQLLKELMNYKAFSDIEFNDTKSINCQAYSVALCISLIKHNLLEKALENPDTFQEINQNEYKTKDKTTAIQGMLF